jgi:hypothetical protein
MTCVGSQRHSKEKNLYITDIPLLLITSIWICYYRYPNKMHMLQSVFYLTNCSTCFGCHYHPSSGAQTTVTTASGNRYTVLLSAAIMEELELI